MNLSDWIRHDATRWELPPHGEMGVPLIACADEPLLLAMEESVRQQASQVAALPGCVGAVYLMPDAHWGYGFPIGAVAAFDAASGGVISAAGVGLDVACGVRCLLTGLGREQLLACQRPLADVLAEQIPAGMGSTGPLSLEREALEAMLRGGARWAVERGWGRPADLDRCEQEGRMPGAEPEMVSALACRRQRRELGTLGSCNHYLEVQAVAEVWDPAAAAAFGLAPGAAVVMIHCGSRGLGHQVGSDYLAEMAARAPEHGLQLPDRELACAPILSPLGQRYLGAMRAAINCALANRQILTHLTREVFGRFWAGLEMPLLYDVCHNTCQLERHAIGGRPRWLHVHRKGATRALGPGDGALPEPLRATGQPVLIGGSMGSGSWVLAGSATAEERALASASHGAGRVMSRRQALKQWSGRQLVEEAPGAYKDVDAVVRATEAAGLARRVARLEPLIVIKG